MMRPKPFARWLHRPVPRLAVVAVAGIALTATACSSGGSGESSGDTVKIGVINTFGQGAQSESADDQFDGMQLGKKYIESHGGLYNGASMEFVQGNENAQAALVATTARKMVNDDVKLIIGPALTPTASPPARSSTPRTRCRS